MDTFQPSMQVAFRSQDVSADMLKANHETEMQRQARVDQLVEKLTQQLAQAPESLPEPRWSSRPLILTESG
jgi:hypothetical protein